MGGCAGYLARLHLLGLINVAVLGCFIALHAAVIHRVFEIGQWDFRVTFAAMASAYTGGAVVVVRRNLGLNSFLHKFAMATAGCFGVAMFGFVIAALSTIIEPFTKILGFSKNTGCARRYLILAFLFLSFVAGWGVLGAVALRFLEHWDFFTGFEAIVNIELGGGIAPLITLPNIHHQLIYCMLGCKFYADCSAIVAFLAGPLSEIFEDVCCLAPSKTHGWNALKFTLFVVLVLPFSLIIAMLLVASWSVLRGESDQFHTWFWLALPAVSGGAASIVPSLGTWHPTVLDRVIFITGSALGFFIFSAAIGIGGAYLEPMLKALGLNKHRSTCHAVVVLLLSATIIIPVAVYLLALPIGGLTALAEDWPFMQGFWWSVDVQLGGGMNLSSGTLTSRAGRILAVIATGFSIGISSLSVALASCPAVAPLADIFGLEKESEHLEMVSERDLHELEDEIEEDIEFLEVSEDSEDSEESETSDSVDAGGSCCMEGRSLSQ